MRQNYNTIGQAFNCVFETMKMCVELYYHHRSVYRLIEMTTDILFIIDDISHTISKYPWYNVEMQPLLTQMRQFIHNGYDDRKKILEMVNLNSTTPFSPGSFFTIINSQSKLQDITELYDESERLGLLTLEILPIT